MSFDILALEPQIREILSAPGTDLTTISAKSVRRKLLELEPTLTAEFLKEHKEEVDAVIGRVFEVVSAEAGGVEAPTEPKHKRVNGTVKEEEVVENVEDEDKEVPSPPPKKTKRSAKKALSDAELARQLSNQINGRARRSAATNGSGTRKKRAHKSADFVDSDSDGDHSTKKKRKSGGGAKGGFAKEYSLRCVMQ
jgi:upstream activation factor subunit UAF30